MRAMRRPITARSGTFPAVLPDSGDAHATFEKPRAAPVDGGAGVRRCLQRLRSACSAADRKWPWPEGPDVDGAVRVDQGETVVATASRPVSHPGPGMRYWPRRSGDDGFSLVHSDGAVHVRAFWPWPLPVGG